MGFLSRKKEEPITAKGILHWASAEILGPLPSGLGPPELDPPGDGFFNIHVTVPGVCAAMANGVFGVDAITAITDACPVVNSLNPTGIFTLIEIVTCSAVRAIENGIPASDFEALLERARQIQDLTAIKNDISASDYEARLEALLSQ